MFFKMKKLVFNIIVLLGVSLLSIPTFAQDDDAKYGENPEECKRDLSEYIEFVKQKNYIDALPAWRRVYNSCPSSSKSIFLNGPKIFGKLIKSEKDEVKKLAYIDTLMQIYDKRIELFGSKGNVLGRKGNDLYKYNKKGAFELAYGYMKESVELSGAKSQAAVLQSYMSSSAMMYKNKKIDAGQVVQDFSIISDNLSSVIEKQKGKIEPVTNTAETTEERKLTKDEKKLAQLKKVEENVGKLFISTGAGSCEVLIAHFTPKFEATPTDVELLKTITKYLDKGDCTDSQLFFDASVNLYDAEPSAQAAYNLAKMAYNKKQMSKAAEFYLKAIELEEDNEKKAQYYYELAAASSSNPSQARSYALKAISLKPGWGKPYLLIGRFYAASGCGDSKFTKGSVFWLAVDKFKKAKAVDASVAAEANKLIATYKVYFPSKEDAFAYNVIEGAEVKIDCWINESTKARF